MLFGNARVMLAEDDPAQRESIAEVLRARGHDVVCVEDGEGVKQFIDDAVYYDKPMRRVHVLVTDLHMPNMGGLDVLRYLEELGVHMPTVVVTAYGTPEARATALRLGALAVLQKPLDGGELAQIIDEILREAA